MSEGAGDPRLGYALVVCAASAWGTWPLVLRRAHAEGEIAQELVSFVVYVTLVGGSVPFLLRDRSKERAGRADWLLLAWLGVSSAANTGLFFLAYARARVAVAVLTHCLAPLVVAAASPLLLREAPRARTLAAIAVALVGLALVLAPWRGPLGSGDLAGAGFGAASALFYASNVIVSKKLAGKFSATELVVLHGFVALPLLAAFVPPAAWAAASPRAVVVVALGGLGPGALAGLAFNWGLRRVPATHAAMLTLLEPACAVLLGALVMHQTIDAVGVAGIVLVLAASLAVLADGARADSAKRV